VNATSPASLRNILLQTARGLGVFRLSRALWRGRLPILCLHGFEIEDESRFRPKLFMQREVLRSRLEGLRRARFDVLPLDEALNRLAAGTLPPRALAITIDDGFYSVLSLAAPLLREFAMPATLYVTSYYVVKRVPIFRLVVQYMLWKAPARVVDLAGAGFPAPATLDLADARAVEAFSTAVLAHGEQRCDEPRRQEICRRLGERLGVGYEAIVQSRKLSLVTPEELPQLQRLGIDVQLHTHRHRLAAGDADEIRREIRDNRAVLEPALGKRTQHFCYPSGEWNASQWSALAAASVVSATTCEPGLNEARTPPLALYRTLDSNDLPQVAVDAELHGLGDLVRTLTGRRRASDALRKPAAAAD
jgi:peptidoglycan/xylan/chitin deacetylase (PgdA/CDA1 family)